jgi:hypothetical protein
MRNKLTIIIFIFFLSLAYAADGQKLVNSPYSRFNLGSLGTSGSFRSLGMGGIGTALRDNASISYSNPASYSSLDTTSFVFDFGVDYSLNTLSNGVSKFSSRDGNFDHLIMGFPIAKRWGVALGVVPYSNGYYKMSESVLKKDPAYNPLIGEYISTHSGDGGFNSYFLGTGLSLGKNFSVGVNMTLLLGEVRRTNQFDFVDYSNVFNDNSTETLHLSGINFDWGLQYTTSIKKDYFFNAGISMSSNKHYTTKFDHLTNAFTSYGTSDTVSYIKDDSTKTYIPGTLRVGISFGKRNKLTVGFDFVDTKWSKSKIPGSVGFAADTKSYLFGLEFIPDKFANYSFLKRIEYRVGGHVADNYLIINGEQLKNYGVSFGMGIPMRYGISKTNLVFDYSRTSGSTVNNLHTENYYTLGISLNLYDWWFRKRKYE